MRNFIAVLVCILPSFIGVLVLRLLGHKIGKKVRIGFSFICAKQITLEDNVKIGHFNLIINNALVLNKGVCIGYLNMLKGPFNLLLKEKAAIGKKKGGLIKSSASKRADGIAKKGKTRGKMV